MKKNWINWKRTVLGSIFEVLGAILLTLLLVWARSEVVPEPYPTFDFYMLQKPFYPTNTVGTNPIDGSLEFKNTNYDITSSGLRLREHMSNSNYILNVDTPAGPLYQPLIDFLGPLYFFPQTCFSRGPQGKWRKSSNIIGYIQQDNEVQADVLLQLELLMGKQRYMKEFVGRLRRILEGGNPSNEEVLSLLLELTDGANADQQIELLAAFGIPSPVVNWLKLQRSTDTPLTAEEVTLVLEQSLTTVQQNVQLVTAIVAEQIVQAQTALQETTLEEITALINLSQEQREQLQAFLADLFAPLYTPPTSEQIAQLSTDLGLTAEQEQFLEEILVDLENQPQINLQEPAQQLAQVLTGELSFYEFSQEYQLPSLLNELGFSEEQAAEILAIIEVQQDILILTTLQLVEENNLQTDNIAEQFGLTQSTVRLIELGLGAEATLTPVRVTQILDLDQKTSAELLDVLEGTGTMSEEGLLAIQTAFQLDDEGKDNIEQILITPAIDEQQIAQRQAAFFRELIASQQPENAPSTQGVLTESLAALLLQPLPVPGGQSINFESQVDFVAEALGLDAQTTQALKAISGGEPLNASTLLSLFIPIGNNQVQDEYEESDLNLQRSVRPEQIWDYVDDPLFGNFTFTEFESTASLERYIQDPTYMETEENEGICFAFQVIERAGSAGRRLESSESNDYELELMFNDIGPRSNVRGIPNQKRPAADPTIAEPDANSYMQYQLGGFNQMVNLVANTILRKKTIPTAHISAIVTPIKQEQIWIDGIKILLQLSMTLFTLLMFIPVLYRTVYRIVFEKVTRAKESMRIMGMTDFPYWLSWWAYFSIVNTLVTTGGWACLMINVFSWGSSLTLWLIIWLFGESLFGILLIAQSIFQTPRAAAITTTVVYFGTTFIGSFVDGEDTPWFNKFMCCMFLPQVAMIQSLQVFIEYEMSGIPMNFDTWHLQKENYSVFQGIMQLIGSGAIMLMLGLYLEQVLPKTFGQRKHPLFCLGFPCRKREPKVKILTQDVAEGDNFDTQYLKEENFEPAPREIQQKEKHNAILKVANLRKVYDNGFKAVNGMNIKMYADQIFVLLGHNGAGKTTTISMLTGLLEQSEGEASVFGFDLFNDMAAVRKFMGVCPQHDVLFELLTVEEHLSFFYDLKGGDPALKKEEVERLLVDFGIADKRNALAYTLSGGNKRKLSVAISLCGNSKFVLLDEPTSGMDLQARRQLWNQLKAYKKGRIIVLTTHYMDEADILGDRIGIMTKGKMTCLGSSIFLKNKFGVGYNLTVVKPTHHKNPILMDYLKQNLGPEVFLQSEIQQEMTIRIPQHLSAKFAGFFKDFDQQLDELNILSYGISISTLEEVFLRIGHLEDPAANISCVSEDDPVEKPEITIQKPEAKSDRNSRNSLLNQNSEGRLSIGGSETPAKLNQEQSESEKGTSQGRTQSYQPQASSLNQHESELSEKGVDFNLRDNQKELDTSFWNVLGAVLLRRAQNYRRNKKAVFNEALLPCLIILFGFGLAWLTPPYRSESRIQGLDRLPQPQHILINDEPVIGAGGESIIQQLVDNMPRGKDGEKFIVRLDSDPDTDIYAFGDRVFDLGVQTAPDRRPPWLYGSYLMYKADPVTQEYQFNAFVNLTSQDASMLYPQMMYESILKTATGDPDFQFKLRSTPFPPTYEFMYRAESLNSGLIIFVAAISFAVCMTFVVSYLVVERMEGLKHLQEISGMQLKAYWVGNFIVDFLKLECPVITTVICFHVFSMNMDTSQYVFLLFPLGAIPFCYVTSFLFTADSAAQTFTMFFHFLVIAVLGTVVFALRIVPEQQANGDSLNYWFKIIPTYILSSSVYCDAACDVLANARVQAAKIPGSKSTGGPLEPSVWHWTNNLMDICLPFVHLLFYSFLLMIIELGFFGWIRFRPNKAISREARELDSDVVKEAERVSELDKLGGEAVQVRGLKKVYAMKTKKCVPQALVAVSNLSFALQEGECFALLGVNGAGKSTTFKSLTQEVKPTSGQIKIAGYDIKHDFAKARKLVGYCPQPNLIYENMTVEQHLHYYARIKGIPKRLRSQMVNQAISQLGLESHRWKSSGQLSGGNKRKLCVAIALVGNPPIILLDEPSAGMDPEARRFMWSVVARIAEQRTSAIVLTTHSMDEAEALSTKMGIMVKGGVFKCFGSAQHIKNKFGTGYVIEIKIRDHSDAEFPALVDKYLDSVTDDSISLKLQDTTDFSKSVIDLIEARLQTVAGVAEKRRELYFQVNLYSTISAICEYFQQVEVIEHYGSYMRLKVQRLDKSIGFAFGQVEKLKSQYDMSSYSVSQTTLEQIFQAFADVTFTESSTMFQKTQSDPQEQPKLSVCDDRQKIKL